MTKDARDIIQYLREAIAKAENDDDCPPVQITEMAASNIISELEYFIQRHEQSEKDIQALIRECDRLSDELADKD